VSDRAANYGIAFTPHLQSRWHSRQVDIKGEAQPFALPSCHLASKTLMVMVLISSFLLKSPDRMTARIGGFSDATSTEISSILGLTVVDLSLPSITTTILTDTRVTVLKDGIAIEEDRSVQSFGSKIRSVAVNVMSYILLWCCCWMKLQTEGIHEWL
jgi:hypothetical protein